MVRITRDEELRTAENIAIAEASREIIQRYGEAGRQFVAAYSGLDAGQQLSKGLESIAASEVNPDYVCQNLRQQSGFSAEVLDTARTNAKNIIRGDASRAVRTDDLARRTDSRFGEIGGTNDQFYDQAVIRNGRVVGASQFKFVGASPEAALDKLASKGYSKYVEAGVKITVPADYYDGIKAAAGEKIAGLESQRANALAKGNAARVQELDKRIEHFKKIRSTLRKSSVTNDEAMRARTNPLVTTAREVAGVSHQAGLKGAQIGGAIAGGISAVRNITAVISGEKDFGDAAIDIVLDTGTGAVKGYVSNFGISAVSGVMKNSGSALMRSIAKTNLPAQVATAVLETGKTLMKFASGEIDGVECLEELGQKGAGMTASAMFGTMGLALGPVGVVAGSLIGYALSNALYGGFMAELKGAKLAREERIRIERECERAIEMLKEYRANVEAMVSRYLTDHITAFHGAFDAMKEALGTGDIDGFIAGANAITEKLGGRVQFRNMGEFDSLMMSDEAFVL